MPRTGARGAPARAGACAWLAGARPALAALAGLGLLVSFTSTSAQWHGTAEVGGTITTGTWVAGEESGGGEPADLDDEESVPAPAADTADTPGLTEEDLD